MVLIINGFSVTVDDDQVERVQSLSWTVRTQYGRQHYFMSGNTSLHRLIMDSPNDKVVDHINGDTLDNRKQNLRICTVLQNQYNQQKHKRATHSKYKGVTFRKNLKKKPWEAFIYAHGKSKRLGYFATEYEAAEAYNKAAQEAYGEFARLNIL